MTNRENLLSLLRRQGYEHVPVEFILCPSLKEELREKYGIEDSEEYFGFAWRKVEEVRLVNHDVEQYRPYFDPPLAEDADIDQWGVGHEKSPNSMHMTYMRHPLEHAESVEELASYPFPDFEHAQKEHQKIQAEAIKARDLIALGDMQITLWEISWYLRGMNELFCDMMDGNEMAEFMFDKALEMAKIRAKAYIEAGVDVLNPIQSECMDFQKIYETYGNQISFHGTIGTQTTMPKGTPQEVIETVHRNLDIAGKKGGLFVAPTHMLEPEVPLENIFAYVEACRTYKV